MTDAERRRSLALRQRQAQLRAEFPQPQGGVSTDSQAIEEFRPKASAAVAGLVNGASFGLADEATGLIEGVGGVVTGDGFSQPYRDGRDRVRLEHQLRSAKEPLAYTGGEIAGAMVPAIAAAPYAAGASTMGTLGRGAAIGGVEGGLHGFGNSKAQGIEDIAMDTAQGAALGGLFGMAAPAAIGAARAGARAVRDPASGLMDLMTQRPNQRKAQRSIFEAIEASKKTPEQLSQEMMRAAQAGQPEFRVMDALGIAGQRKASGLSRSGGDAGTEIAEFLASRQAGQGDRVSGFVDEAFGLDGTTAAKATDAMKAQRSTTANAAYDAARGNAAPVDVRGALAVIDDRIGGMAGSNVTGDGIDAKLARYRSRLAADQAPDGTISVELSDFDRVLGVKQAIQDDIGAAVRAGRNNEARELGKLVTSLDEALEQSSDMYRAANDGFRTASQTIDAVGQGEGMVRPSARAQDTTAQFGAMTPEQQTAARVGYGDRLLAQLEANKSPTANRAKSVSSPKLDAEAQAMAANPDLYAERLARENTMWSTQNTALGGSRTADNMQDIAQAEDVAGGLMGALRSGLNLQIGDAVAKAGGALRPIANGQTDATRALIARALMSDDPAKALGPAIQRGMRSKKQNAVLEALMRQLLTQSAQ